MSCALKWKLENRDFTNIVSWMRKKAVSNFYKTKKKFLKIKGTSYYCTTMVLTWLRETYKAKHMLKGTAKKK